MVSSVPARGYDLWCLTMSLPHLLGIDGINRVPTEPWLAPEAPGTSRTRFRAGINWAGNPSFQYDRIRSTSLDTVSDLLAIEGVEWVSLHRGARESEAEAHGLPQPLAGASDFLDTAAVVAGLDLVVSTETAIPNLSAAMGVPTDPSRRGGRRLALAVLVPRAHDLLPGDCGGLERRGGQGAAGGGGAGGGVVARAAGNRGSGRLTRFGLVVRSGLVFSGRTGVGAGVPGGDVGGQSVGRLRGLGFLVRCRISGRGAGRSLHLGA